jgi:FkbM family methyltransferase
MNAKLLKKAAALLVRNPSLLLTKVLVKLNSYRALPASPCRKKINGVLFEFDFDLDPAVREMYLGSYQVEVVKLMRKFITRGSTFLDVGANIGYLSAIGMGLVGTTGEVHGFEPVPEYCSRLRALASANPAYRLTVNQFALGAEHTTARVSTSRLPNIGWATMVPGLMDTQEIKYSVDTEVQRLDRYIESHNLANISLLKIDCEGYEFPVLKGLQGYFATARVLPPILCELAPAAYPLSGESLAGLETYMSRYRYQAFSTVDCKTAMDIRKLEGTTDIVFLAR